MDYLVNYQQKGDLKALSPALAVLLTPRISLGLTLNFWSDWLYDNGWTEDLPELSWVDRRFTHCGIRFFILNSVAGLSSSRPDYAAFSESALRSINRSLVGDDPDSTFSIAVSHHGLRPDGAVNTVKGVDEWPDLSCRVVYKELGNGDLTA